MKTHFFKIVFLMLSALNATAQNSKSGIYLSFSDYGKNKLTYEIDCKTEKHAIKLNEFLNESFITVKHKGKKIKLQKDSIYGVLNCDGPLIRFQNKEHFNLAEKGSIWIFYKEAEVAQSKGFRLEKQYYFSTKGDGKLIELTVENVKKSFPDNHVLHDMIDVQFQNVSINEYDSFHKMFKINHIIKAANSNSVCPVHSEEKGKEGDKCSVCGMEMKQE